MLALADIHAVIPLEWGAKIKEHPYTFCVMVSTGDANPPFGFSIAKESNGRALTFAVQQAQKAFRKNKALASWVQ